MKKCAFTICAKNYIGLALIMESSLKKYNDDITFYIFVADEFGSETTIPLPNNILIAKNILSISASLWIEMSFKYDITEFCTSLKPFCFSYLLENTKFETFCYFDPDVYFFNSLDIIYQSFTDYNILLTPHILDITSNDFGENTQNEIRGTGMFNLGFLGLKRSYSMSTLLKWWCDKLKDCCFNDVLTNQFTDQKWMDFLPIFFSKDELLVFRNLGLNLAPWNYYERKVIREYNQYKVCKRNSTNGENHLLIFAHYSGYDYNEMKKTGAIIQKNIPNIPSYDDINPLLITYAQAIKANSRIFDIYLNLNYSYGFFDNGIPIDIFHRRLYHGLILADKKVDNPYSTSPHTFYSLLKQNKMFTKDRNLNKYNKNNYSRLNFYLNKINLCMRILYKLIGYKQYSLLIKLFRPYSRFENQVFLIDKTINRL